MSRQTHTVRLAVVLGVAVTAELVLAPAASASTGRGLVPSALFGIPSLHSIIKAIATGFFGALAGALVPDWLKHGTVATIQHLVALPDPAAWPHVRRLEGDSTYLGAMLLPVTLAVGALRYWLVGLTGSAHPASAVTRSVAVTGVLVMYGWIVEQTVDATNTITHGVLELPAVGEGLRRIIGVLFGGALLSGAGSVFGALLVIVGVVFAAGLFAAQVLMTVVLAVLIVAGPPLIAVSAIPELSHLARNWAYALLAVTLVPLGWTVLFVTAGALCLDATSFTGASGGLPGHVAAAFAGLITFVIAARLPLMAVGQLRQLFTAHGPGAGSSGGSSMPGSERVRSAHARLRTTGLQGVPSLGRSAGRVAGALGAPRGGALGAARRGLAGAAGRVGLASVIGAGASHGAARGKRSQPPSRGVRARFAEARTILARAPADALAATRTGQRPTPSPTRAGNGPRAAGEGQNRTAPAAATGDSPRRKGADAASAVPKSTPARSSSNRTRPAVASQPTSGPQPTRAQRGPGQPTPPRHPEMHPTGKPADRARPNHPEPSSRSASAPAPSEQRKGTSAKARPHPASAPRTPKAPARPTPRKNREPRRRS